MLIESLSYFQNKNKTKQKKKKKTHKQQQQHHQQQHHQQQQQQRDCFTYSWLNNSLNHL